MKANITLIWLIACAASIIFAVAAFTLAYNNIDGWGWFLLCSVLCCSGSSAKRG